MGTALAPYRVLERLVRQNGDRPLRTDLDSRRCKRSDCRGDADWNEVDWGISNVA
jgi:hypothetical protein